MSQFPIKYYNSLQTNAPQLSGTAGSLIAILDAMLLTGFNPKTPFSVLKSDTTITSTVTAGHGFSTGDKIQLSGATQTEYNGEWKITVISPTVFTFQVPSNYSAVISGTLEFRYPRVSSYWEKVSSGTNKAIYRSTHPDGTNWYLRVDDTPTRCASVTMTENFTSIDTGLVNTSTLGWMKSEVETSATRYWSFVGDGKRFYLCLAWNNYGNIQPSRFADPYFFGDIIPTKPGDAYHCALYGVSDLAYYVTNPSTQSSTSYFSANNTNGNSAGSKLLRSYSQIGPQVPALKYSMMRGSMGYNGWDYPNRPDNGIFMDIVYVFEGTSVRGFQPGLFCPLNAIGSNLAAGDLSVKNPPQMPDREFVYIRLAGIDWNSPGGAFWDITGPWSD
jgi:hypothetical protein